MKKPPDLVVHQTDTMPLLQTFRDEGLILMSGTANPDDVFELFAPLHGWLEEYFTNPPGHNIFQFSLDYINNSFSLALLDLFKQLEKRYKQGVSIQVKWFYPEDDEDIFYAGEDFSELVSFPFQLLAC